MSFCLFCSDFALFSINIQVFTLLIRFLISFAQFSDQNNIQEKGLQNKKNTIIAHKYSSGYLLLLTAARRQ